MSTTALIIFIPYMLLMMLVVLVFPWLETRSRKGEISGQSALEPFEAERKAQIAEAMKALDAEDLIMGILDCRPQALTEVFEDKVWMRHPIAAKHPDLTLQRRPVSLVNSNLQTTADEIYGPALPKKIPPKMQSARIKFGVYTEFVELPATVETARLRMMQICQMDVSTPAYINGAAADDYRVLQGGDSVQFLRRTYGSGGGADLEGIRTVVSEVIQSTLKAEVVDLNSKPSQLIMPERWFNHARIQDRRSSQSQ